MKNAGKKSNGHMGDITLLLSDVRNPEGLRTVIRLLYDELHRIAARKVREEAPGHTFQATDLLDEACIRLLKGNAALKNRRYFFAAAAETMRRILVGEARRRNARKRGGGWARVDFEAAERIGFERPHELLDFDAVLCRMERAHPRLAEVARLRVFGEWSTTEAAGIIGIAPATARRRWAQARRWLRAELADQGPGDRRRSAPALTNG